MELEIRPFVIEEYEAWVRSVARAFGEDLNYDFLEVGRPVYELGQGLAVFENGEIVGATFAHPGEMIVPGGRLPAAMLDDVSVQPTHRRRGILTRMTE